MGREGIEQLLYMMDQAFEGDTAAGRGNWHALLVNLESVRDEDWNWLPADGRRSIFVLARELGECKYVYASHIEGDRSFNWDHEETIPTVDDGTAPSEVIAYLRRAQDYLRSRVDGLSSDTELWRLQTSPQGWERETRWMIKTMIEHDIYHAGEINHLRALAQRND
jgi:hypothetical protein